MLPLLFILAALLAAIAWLFGLPLLQGQRRARRAQQPIPPHWRDWLHDDLGIYRQLPQHLRERLHGLIRLFVEDKEFVGCNGLLVTERMRVVIAAYACLLVVNRPGVPRRYLYDDLFSILVYPTPFIVPHSHRDEHGLVNEGHRILSGQAWDSRRIILSWEDVEAARDHAHNVVLHEFAHYLDMEDETMDGAPGLRSKAEYQQWSEVFWCEYERLREDLQTGRPSLLDPYAATAPAEFFAVVTETFFQQPRALQEQHPGLYEQLRKYYRLDPARWAAASNA